MNIIACPDCGVQFSISDEYGNTLRQCHNTFFCPNGHTLHYADKTNEEKKIEVLERNCKFFKENYNYYKGLYHDMFRSRAYYKGQITKLKSKNHKGGSNVRSRIK